jgi:3-dehydroquinate synthase
LSEIIQIDTKQKSYAIYLDVSIVEQLKSFLQTPGLRVFVVYDEHLKEFYNQICELGSCLGGFELPSGEASKNIENFFAIQGELMRAKFRRTDYLIALGGGVVGDLTGFAAATYQRGCKFIQIPTTILSQVDSSVGGKTAINHQLGKNMIGAFYQPDAVIIDLSLLNTLPKRQKVNGFAEIIKAAILKDKKLFEVLESIDDIESCNLATIISSSIKVKKYFVESDEKDLGLRNQLNLGHTFGHAIETIHQYETYLHGEAVAIGMLIAAQFSFDNNLIDESSVLRVKQLIEKLGLPSELPSLCTPEKMLDAMLLDKRTLHRI